MAEDPECTPKQDMSLLCRVCANQHDYLIPIFQGEGLDHEMPTKMNKHLPIKVRESDKLPTQMCYQCASTIIAWSELHTNCVAADKKLKGMLKINEKKARDAARADDAGSDHYEDAYDDVGGGGDDDDDDNDDEDFEKEIKQLISDAGVELDSKSERTSKRPSRAAATRKRKAEITITPVKREPKKPKTEPKSSSGLLKPKEEVLSNDDRLQIWSCCMCCATFVSCDSLSVHMSQHENGNWKNEEKKGNDNIVNVKREIDNCFQCLTAFSSHSISYHSGPIFICHNCNQSFTEKLTLEYHTKIEHGNLLFDIPNLTWYACKICCNFLYKREQDIIKHMENFHDDPNVDVTHFIVKTIQDFTFPCEVCGRKCVLTKYCTEHTKKRPSKKAKNIARRSRCTGHGGKHECQFCKAELPNCTELWSHLFVEHVDKSSEFKCHICSNAEEKFSFKCPPVIIFHMKREHGIKLYLTNELSEFKAKSKTTVKGIIMFKCFECLAMFNSFPTLKTHVLLHSNMNAENPTFVKIRACDSCPKKFPTRRKLLDHHIAVHQKLRAFKCTVCGRTFTLKGHLTAHMLIHSGVKRFVCTVCGAAFAQRSGLNLHKFCHSEARFVCTYCGKMFKNPNHLKAHMNLHTGDRIYVCEFCGSEFRSRETWKYHMVHHGSGRTFVCEICNASFKAKKHLSQHYKTHYKNPHGNNSRNQTHSADSRSMPMNEPLASSSRLIPMDDPHRLMPIIEPHASSRSMPMNQLLANHSRSIPMNQSYYA